MLNSLKTAFKLEELRNKLLFTLAMIFLFRVGAHIPVPGVNPEAFADLLAKGQLLAFFDVISGGAFKNASIFAMSITPYINASIIMQLLTVVIPHLERLAKEGEEGRKKITQYTRYFTAVLAFIQAIGMSVALKGAMVTPTVLNYLIVAITFTAGTVLLMWIGEQITDKGIGNGISLIIFAGIVSRIPSALVSIGEYLSAGTINILSVLALVIIGVLVIAAVVTVQEGQRRIPVQYAKRVIGRRVYGGSGTYIPLKINGANVVPIIFASALLFFPLQLSQLVPNPQPWLTQGANALATGPLNWSLQFVLIVFFTYFYTALVFNPIDLSDNLRKNGGFIPGVRPGSATVRYIENVLNRITLPGALFLGVIAVIPSMLTSTTGNSLIQQFGGTSILIMVGVALETMTQIESQLKMRHYDGFFK